MIQNPVLDADSTGSGRGDDKSAAESGEADVATRIARRTVAVRHDEYAQEVRRILDAALALMKQHGTASKPRVADIVAAAGVSNDAFYRHFSSKDALVLAIIEDGNHRLTGYLAHEMAKQAAPEDKVRRWVTGVLAQADGDIAAATLAVLWNGGGTGTTGGRHFSAAPLAALLEEPYVALGSHNAGLDSLLAAHAVLGRLSDYLWSHVSPSTSARKHIAELCVRLPGLAR
jgi:AcrR family transcriptional regulator